MIFVLLAIVVLLFKAGILYLMLNLFLDAEGVGPVVTCVYALVAMCVLTVLDAFIQGGVRRGLQPPA